MLVASGEWEWATTRVLRLVGGRGSFEQLCMIAVLHTGAAICGESTLALCKVAGCARRGPIHVAILRGRPTHRLAGVVLHEVQSLPDHHTMLINGIP